MVEQQQHHWWLWIGLASLFPFVVVGLVWWLIQTVDTLADKPLKLAGTQELILQDQQLTRSQPIMLREHSRLIIANSTLTFDLTSDLAAGIYLFDQAQLIVRTSTLTSNGKMYEIELRGQSQLEASDSQLRNHSAVKLFDDTLLVATDTLVEELRMDDRGRADLTRAEIYPNLQFSKSPDGPLTFPPAFEPATTTVALDGGWTMTLTDTTTQGWQVDVYPGTTIAIVDSSDVNVGLRSNGTSTATIDLENPSDERTSFRLNELGFDLSVENSEIFFVNFYPKGTDQITVRGRPGRTRLLEVVLLDQSQLTLEGVYLMAQLAHANDQSSLTIRRSTIGSDDPDDPIKSELAAQDEAVVVLEDSEATNADLRVSDNGQLTLRDTTYNPGRVEGPITVEDASPESGELLLSAANPTSLQKSCFSPDGIELVFTCWHGGYHIGPADLVRYDRAFERETVVVERHRTSDETSPSDLWLSPRGEP